ncbi:MAG: DUF4164 family protein [Sphingomonadales bacterium]
MSALASATKRIDAALARLEVAVASPRQMSPESRETDGRTEALALERDGLAADLAASRQECDKLRKRASDAADRLADSIDRLENILGNSG